MQSRKTRIFIVDDQWPVIGYTAELLWVFGLAAVSYSNLYQILVALAQDAPELIVWNVTTPLRVCIRFVERVSLRHPNCLSIVITEDVSKPVSSNPSTWLIPKPVQLESLVFALQELGIIVNVHRSIAAVLRKVDHEA